MEWISLSLSFSFLIEMVHDNVSPPPFVVRSTFFIAIELVGSACSPFTIGVGVVAFFSSWTFLDKL